MTKALMVLGLLLGGAGPATTTPAPTPARSAATFQNPVIAEDFPDPDILQVGKTYYAYSTNAGGQTVPVFRSADLVHWDAVGDAMPVLPDWATGGNTWAPDVMKVKGGYALYFTARHTDSGRQCIGVGFATKPDGPFNSPSKTPLVCQLDVGGSIDAAGFTDQDGKAYLYWKNDGNCCSQLTGLWVQPLSPDGQTLTGKPKDLIYNGQLWEGNLIEAPFMYRHGSHYYLFYSAAAWDTDTYAVGYAVATSPLGPFKKSANNPLVATTGPVAGPGGQGIITDGRGQTWMYYHAWNSAEVGYQIGGQRSLRLDPLKWKGDVPVVTPSVKTEPAPAKP
ncbi:glycoside hydrolase family 43 protein [Deinococcus sonorensis]|uniref:Glycoside hydrolase family 43 protein n=2 Tax=Deinococcus sonorensis TaxID=309891 RepID=A0AAU7U4R6_9DEIO